MAACEVDGRVARGASDHRQGIRCRRSMPHPLRYAFGADSGNDRAGMTQNCIGALIIGRRIDSGKLRDTGPSPKN